MIDQINERGGVAGRKLVPAFLAYDAQSSETNESQDQAACETFTVDKKVYASTALGLTENFSACLRKAGVLQINATGIIDFDAEYMRKYPTLFHQRLTQDRMMPDPVKALSRQRYFTGWDSSLARPGTAKVKVGIVTLDRPTFTRPVKKVLLPALAKAGHPVDPSLVFPIAFARTPNQAGATAADVQSATLRLRHAGVTHVIIQDSTASMSLTFLNATRSQRYFPRLGVTSGTGIQALDSAGVVEAQALNGAVGLGWLPTLDMAAGKGDAFLTSATKESWTTTRSGPDRGCQNQRGDHRTGVLRLPERRGGGHREGWAGHQLRHRAPRHGGARRRRAARGRAQGVFSPQQHDGLETGFDLFWETVAPAPSTATKVIASAHDPTRPPRRSCAAAAETPLPRSA